MQLDPIVLIQGDTVVGSLVSVHEVQDVQITVMKDGSSKRSMAQQGNNENAFFLEA